MKTAPQRRGRTEVPFEALYQESKSPYKATLFGGTKLRSVMVGEGRTSLTAPPPREACRPPRTPLGIVLVGSTSGMPQKRFGRPEEFRILKMSNLWGVKTIQWTLRVHNTKTSSSGVVGDRHFG